MLSSTEQLLFLKQVSLFRGMTFGQLQALIAHLEKLQFVAGQVIYEEGETGQNLYIVVCGVVRVVKDYQKPTERELARLETGEFFGEMGIFERKPHMATLIADEDASAFVLTTETLKRLIVQHPSIALEMGRELSARIRRGSGPDQRRETQ